LAKARAATTLAISPSMGRRSLEFDQNSSTGTQDRQGIRPNRAAELLAIAYR